MISAEFYTFKTKINHIFTFFCNESEDLHKLYHETAVFFDPEIVIATPAYYASFWLIMLRDQIIIM